MQPHTKGPPRTSPQKVKCQEKAPAESVQSGWSWGLPWSAPTGWTTCTCTRTLICERAQEQAIPQPKPPEQPARKGNNRLQTYDYSVTGGWQEEVDLEAANPPWNDDVGFLLEQHLVAAALKRQADAAQGSSSSSTSGAAPRTDSPGRPIGTSSERVQNDHQHAGRPQKAPESPQRSAGSASPPQRERGRPKAGDAGGSLAATARDDAHVHDSGLPGSEDADDERGAGLCVGPSTASAEALHSPRPPTSPGCAGVSRCCDGQGEAAFPPQRASISTADPSPGSSSLEGSPELTSGTRQGNSTQSPRTGDCHQTHERQQQRLPTPNNKDPPSTTATTTTTAAAATAATTTATSTTELCTFVTAWLPRLSAPQQ